jgi:hypothetical protein
MRTIKKIENRVDKLEYLINQICEKTGVDSYYYYNYDANLLFDLENQNKWLNWKNERLKEKFQNVNEYQIKLLKREVEILKKRNEYLEIINKAQKECLESIKNL